MITFQKQNISIEKFEHIIQDKPYLKFQACKELTENIESQTLRAEIVGKWMQIIANVSTEAEAASLCGSVAYHLPHPLLKECFSNSSMEMNTKLLIARGLISIKSPEPLNGMESVFVELQNSVNRLVKDIEGIESLSSIIKHQHLFENFSEFIISFEKSGNKLTETISSILLSIAHLLQERQNRFCAKIQDSFFIEENGTFSILKESIIGCVDKYQSHPHLKELKESIKNLPTPTLNFLELLDILIQYDNSSNLEWTSNVLVAIDEDSNRELWRLITLVVIKSYEREKEFSRDSYVPFTGNILEYSILPSINQALSILRNFMIIKCKKEGDREYNKLLEASCVLSCYCQCENTYWTNTGVSLAKKVFSECKEKLPRIQNFFLELKGIHFKNKTKEQISYSLLTQILENQFDLSHVLLFHFANSFTSILTFHQIANILSVHISSIFSKYYDKLPVLNPLRYRTKLMLFILELSIITSKDDSQLVCEKVLEILMQRDKLDIAFDYASWLRVMSLETSRFVYDKWIQKVEMKDIDTLNLLQKRLPFESKEVKNFLFQTLQQLLSNSSLNTIIEEKINKIVAEETTLLECNECLIFEGDIEELVRLYSGSRSLAKQYLQDKLLMDDEKEEFQTQVYEILGKSIIYKNLLHSKLFGLLNYTNLWNFTQIKLKSPPSYLVDYCSSLTRETESSQRSRMISDLKLGLVIDKFTSDLQNPPDLIELSNLLFVATTRTSDIKLVHDLITLCVKFESWIIHQVLENQYRELLMNYQSIPSNILIIATKLLSSLSNVEWHNIFDEPVCNNLIYSRTNTNWKAVEYLLLTIPEKLSTAYNLAQRITWILGKEIHDMQTPSNSFQIVYSLLNKTWLTHGTTSQPISPQLSQNQSLWEKMDNDHITSIDDIRESTNEVVKLYSKEVEGFGDSNVLISPNLRKWLLWELENPSRDQMNTYYKPILRDIFLQIQFNGNAEEFLRICFIDLFKCFASSEKTRLKLIYPIADFISMIARDIQVNWMIDLLNECPNHYLKEKEAIESTLYFFPPSSFIGNNEIDNSLEKLRILLKKEEILHVPTIHYILNALSLQLEGNSKDKVEKFLKTTILKSISLSNCVREAIHKRGFLDTLSSWSTSHLILQSLFPSGIPSIFSDVVVPEETRDEIANFCSILDQLLLIFYFDSFYCRATAKETNENTTNQTRQILPLKRNISEIEIQSFANKKTVNLKEQQRSQQRSNHNEFDLPIPPAIELGGKTKRNHFLERENVLLM